MNEKIKYANCWEDADLLLLATNLPKNSNILSIASGGDNSLALLSTVPKQLVAVDTNVAQLHLCELKAVAFSELNYDEMIDFFWGLPQAKEHFERIKKQLSPACQKFWEVNENAVCNGILHSGKFENYFHFFRTKIVPLVHAQNHVLELLSEKTEQEQVDFYNEHWNTWRWRFLFRLFFSKFILGRFGRTKSYLNHVEIPVADFIYQQTAQHLQSKDCQSNYFLQYIFKGNFATEYPFYLRKENFNLIKENLSVLTLKQGLAQDFVRKENDFNFCNFSNIFEYMSQDEFTDFHHILLRNLPDKAIFSYWNLMVNRVFSVSFPTIYAVYNPTERLQTDKGFFYKRFVTEIKNGG